MNSYAIIGFTGTQRGLTFYQQDELTKLLRAWNLFAEPGEFHHGDCIGADEQAARVAASLGYETVAHPPVDPKKRAFYNSARFLPELPYLQRNHMIVEACDHLIACPGEGFERLRSGTWATVRFARKLGRPLTIIYPDSISS